MNQLIVKESSEANELNTIADKLQTYIGNQDNTILTEVAEALNKKPSLRSRLFPSALDRERNTMTVESLRVIYENQIRFFKLYCDVRFEVASRLANALVKSVGIDLQTKLTKFVQARISELRHAIASNRQEFLEEIKPQLERLERDYKDFPELYEPAHASIVKEIQIFFESISALLEGFIENLTSKISEG
jgi:hypothetical protein